jgi:hypothetical protein
MSFWRNLVRNQTELRISVPEIEDVCCLRGGDNYLQTNKHTNTVALSP